MVREIALPRYAGQFDDPEPPPIRNLRSYTSYLAPKGGLFSGDTWTLVATYLRNLILNWSMLLPLLSLLALLPALNLEFDLGRVEAVGTLVFLFAVVVLVCISLVCASLSLPGMQAKWKLSEPTKRWLTTTHLTAICLAAVGLAAWAHSFLLHRPGLGTPNEQIALALFAVVPLLVFAFLRYGTTEQKRWSSVLGWTHFRNYLSGYLFAALASAGIATGLMFVLYSLVHWNERVFLFKPLPEPFWWSSESLFRAASSPATVPFGFPADRLFTTIAVPWATLAFVLIGWALNGFISSLESEDDREWWARSGAYLMMFAAGWAVVHGVVLYAGPILHQIAAVVGGIVGPILGGLGFSRFTGSGMAKSGVQLDGKLKQLLGRFALPLAAFVALVSLIVLMAWGNENVISWLRGRHVSAAWAYLGYAGASLVMLTLGNWYFNVNTFSMHGLLSQPPDAGIFGIGKSQTQSGSLHAIRSRRQRSYGGSPGQSLRATSCCECNTQPGRREESRMAGTKGGTVYLLAIALRQRQCGLSAHPNVRWRARAHTRHDHGHQWSGCKSEHGISLVCVDDHADGVLQCETRVVAAQPRKAGCWRTPIPKSSTSTSRAP
jgi:hypothetical protein